jgi:probable phosphoglycerate mutase
MGILTLLRHGETDYNARFLFQGRADEPLNASGIAQAQRAAEAIGKVDRVISSPLKRAMKTADAFGMTLDIDDQWIECNFGDWEGHPISSIGGSKWDNYKTNPNFRPPNGETITEVNHRVHAALDKLTVAKGEHLLVVSHTLPIKAAFMWVLGGDVPIMSTRLSTASYTQIEFSGNERTLLNFNITS